MLRYGGFGPHNVDESKLASLTGWQSDWDSIGLENPTKDALDSRVLCHQLGGLPGIENIRTLHIEPTSQLTDVSVIAAFPNLETLFVKGSRIATLEGIESFRGRYLEITTGPNKKRNLDALPRSHVYNRILLVWAGPADLVALGGCRHLRGGVTLGSAPAIDFALWSELPIRDLQVNSCPIKVFDNCAHVKSLRELTFINCSKLERFAGDCSNIEVLSIDPPKALDWKTLGALSGLKIFSVGSHRSARPFPLSALLPLTRVERVAIQSAPLELDVTRLKSALPRLLSLAVRRGSVADPRALSSENPGVLFSVGELHFQDGRLLAASDVPAPWWTR